MSLDLRLPKNLQIRPWHRLLLRLARLEHEHGTARRQAKEPAMDIPEHLHRQPVHQNRLVPSELPRQPPHPHDRPPVDVDHETRVVRAGVALDRNVMTPAMVRKLGLGGEDLLADDVLLPGHEQRVDGGPAGARLAVGLLPHVAQQEHHLAVAYHRDVEAFHRFRRRAEPGAGQVPEHVDLADGAGDVEGLGALALGEEPRLDVGPAETVPGHGVGRDDADGRRLSSQAAAPGPRDRERARPPREPRVVEARDPAPRRRGGGAALAAASAPAASAGARG